MIREKVGKLHDLFTMLCIAFGCKAMEIKNDEDAMEIIQVVMIIAVGVLAIVAVWAGINGFIEDLWERIIGAEQPDGPSLGGE